MNLNFALLLVSIVFISGFIVLIDYIFFIKKRRKAVADYKDSIDSDQDISDAVVSELNKEPILIETAKSIFPVLLLVLVIRSFIYEPFQIPSGSMIPTLQIGDFILVDKYSYGLRLPAVSYKVWSNKYPKRGDVMVFKEPKNPSVNFIKRVIGLPGDIIVYENKKLFINDKEIEEVFVKELSDNFEVSLGRHLIYRIYTETIGEGVHKIRKDLDIINNISQSRWEVPPDHYFVMGDNRDRSNDSRYWGFVPEENIVGKAIYVWMHWKDWLSMPSFINNGAIM